MEGPAVKQNEISSFGLQFQVIAKRLFSFILLWNLVPVFLVLQQALLFEILVMVKVRLRDAYETSLVLFGVC